MFYTTLKRASLRNGIITTSVLSILIFTAEMRFQSNLNVI